MANFEAKMTVKQGKNAQRTMVPISRVYTGGCWGGSWGQLYLWEYHDPGPLV